MENYPPIRGMDNQFLKPALGNIPPEPDLNSGRTRDRDLSASRPRPGPLRTPLHCHRPGIRAQIVSDEP